MQVGSNIQPNREKTSAGSKCLRPDKRLYVTFESSSLFALLASRLLLQGEVGGSHSIYCVLVGWETRDAIGWIGTWRQDPDHALFTCSARHCGQWCVFFQAQNVMSATYVINTIISSNIQHFFSHDQICGFFFNPTLKMWYFCPHAIFAK